jgi:hypothetical protein
VVLDAEVRQQAEQEDHGNRDDDDQVQDAASAPAGGNTQRHNDDDPGPQSLGRGCGVEFVRVPAFNSILRLTRWNLSLTPSLICLSLLPYRCQNAPSEGV